MRNEDYWRQREEEWLARKQAEEIDLERRIRDMYLYLSASIEDEIGAFYQKYANSTGVSYAEAVRRIDSFDVKAFENKAKKYVETKDFSAKANAELKIYNATMKINRLELLKSAIGYDCVDTFNDLENLFDTTLFKRSTEELDRQAGILGGTLSDNQKLARFIVDGDFNSAHWSDRLWMYQTELKNKISDLLLSGLVQGKHPKELARDITQYAKKDPTINTLRLMRTELARVQTDSQMAAFREMGFESYVFISLEGSPKTCSICAGLDGKIFPVGDTEHLPPQHPNCRCSTAAYSSREQLSKDLGVDLALPKNEHFDITEGGKYIKFPNMSKTDYADLIKDKLDDMLISPTNPDGLTLRDYKQIWDKNYGYIQASPSYKEINGFWRGDKGVRLTKEQHRTRIVMDKLTNKFELDDNYIAYRKVDPSYFCDLLGIDVLKDKGGFHKSSKATRDSALSSLNAKLSKGKVSVSDAAVTSVSLVENLNYFKMRPVLFEIQMPKGTKGLLTSNYDESEFIAKTDSSLEFIKAEEYNYTERGKRCYGIKYSPG